MAPIGKPDLILGTAGHIDHGKSALILALTGTDPDRLAEEKRRGITIKLGFAQLVLPDGRTMGVVDVPGHEKFMKQMIAGSTGIDVALLTIAADDGVMPQTIEHVAILQTLGVPACVVALTKTDLVDEEWVGFMTDEVRTYLSRTAYADAAIVAVSSKTGAGLGELLAAIQSACKGVRPARQMHPMRMPIDRVFTIKGAGTVVTGTLWSGQVEIDDDVELSPSGRICRVRSLQMHDQPVTTAPAGNRVALNLNNVKTDEVQVGDWVAAPETLQETDRFDAWITYLDTAATGKALQSGSRMHIAHGTSEVLGRVLFCNGLGTLAPGQSTYAQIRLEQALPICYQDRFIIRTYSPVQVAGGGTVLLPHPRRRTNLADDELMLLDALRDQDVQASTETALKLQHDPVTARELAKYLGLQTDDVATCLQTACAAKHAIRIGNGYYSTQATRRKLIAAIDRTLIDFHNKNPEAAGMAKEALRQQVAPRCPIPCFDALLTQTQTDGLLVITGGEVGHPSASGAARKAERTGAESLSTLLKAAGMAPSSLTDLAKQIQMPANIARRSMALLEREGRVCRISSEVYFDSETVEACKRTIEGHLRSGGDGTVAALRDVMGTSRKFALPLLEHFDSIGFTVRNGDTRTLRQG